MNQGFKAVQDERMVLFMKKGKVIGLIVGVVFISAMVFGISRVAQNPEKYQGNSNVDIILDASSFSKIKVEELTSKMGEADGIEDWNNKTQKGEFQMKIYTYNKEGYYVEFITFEDSVVKLRCFANEPWKYEGENKDVIFSMFGVTPGENAKKSVDTGVTYKFSPVSDKVAEFEIYNLDDKAKTFDTVYIAFNLNYFD